jgi:hypothetical protein
MTKASDLQENYASGNLGECCKYQICAPAKKQSAQITCGL